MNERSKADDVAFILELISKVVKQEPVADEDNVNLIGTSNGAGLIYRIIIDSLPDRPFRRCKTSSLDFFLATCLFQGFPTRLLPFICSMA